MRRLGNVGKLVCRPYLILYLYRIAESHHRKRTVEILRFWHGAQEPRVCKDKG
jgi:hypothetical protein